MKTQYFFLASILLLVPACGKQKKKVEPSRHAAFEEMYEPSFEETRNKEDLYYGKELGMKKEVGMDMDEDDESDESLVIINEDIAKEDLDPSDEEIVVYDLEAIEVETDA